MSEKIIFRLINGKKKGTYSLRGGVAEKDGILKTINYYPGSNSIFDEDNRKNGIRPRPVVFSCNNNKADMAVEIIVDSANKVLVDYLKARKEFGSVYAIYNLQTSNKRKIDNFNKIEKALAMVSESDELKVKAIAVAVLGFEYFSFTVVDCAAALKEKAIQEPQKIISAFSAEDYESRYIAALSFIKNILRPNETHTAVVWADSNGKIVNVAPGEDPLNKLVEFIRTGGRQSEALLQEIGTRIQLPEEKTKDPKEIEISELKAQIQKLEKMIAKTPVVKSSDKDGNEVIEKVALTEEEQLVLATEMYQEKFGKKVPANMKYNLEWIKLKLLDE